MPDQDPKPKPDGPEGPPSKPSKEHRGLRIGGVTLLKASEQISAEEFARRVEKASADFLDKRKRDRGE